MNKRLLIVFCLGFSSGIPLALLTGTLQAWFSVSDMSVAATGLLSLAGMPYLYKMFWAPLLDRFDILSLGRRRSWMLFTQLTLMAGFNLMAFFSPQESSTILIFLAFTLSFVSATQDTAVDAQRAEYLTPKLYGIGVSLAVLAYRLALIASGGLALILAGYWGWPFMYRIMGFLMLPGVLATLLSEEPVKVDFDERITFLRPLMALFARKGILSFIFFILLYKMGEVFTSSNSGIVMPFLIQGLGFSLSSIAYINKILGIFSILMGGLIAGFILMRFSLYASLMCFGLLQALTSLLFLAMAITGKNTGLFATAVVLDNFAAGMASTALVTLFMRVVDKRFTATQFSFLVAVASLPRVFSGPMAAWLQSLFGWVGLYQLAFLLALGFIPWLVVLAKKTDFLQFESEPEACGEQSSVWNETESRG